MQGPNRHRLVSSAATTTCPILFQDRWLIVVNKPSGVLSHPNPGGKSSAAAFAGRYDLKQRCFKSAAGSVWLVHRLDQDTSGVLMAARDAATARECRTAFEQGQVRKTYLALVSGFPKSAGTWRDHLGTARERHRVRTQVLKNRPPNAELRYRVVSSSREHRLSLVEIDLITGRTHQIRVQAASRNHPLIGDDVYGDFELNRRLRRTLGVRRLCLHAIRVELQHPVTGGMLRIEAPLPDDIATVVGA